MVSFTSAALTCVMLIKMYNVNSMTLTEASTEDMVASIHSNGHLASDQVENPLFEEPSHADNLSSHSTINFQESVVRKLTDTEFPSSSPMDLSQPSAYLVPLLIQSEIPTATLGKFDWDLNQTAKLTAIFSDESKQGEIFLSYKISLRQAVVEVRTVDCITVVDSTYVTVSHNTTVISSTHGRLDIVVDIKQDTIINSPIWRPGNTTREGFLDMCLRVDLFSDDDGTPISVNFHEQQIFLTIGLSQDFQVDTINLTRDDADTVFQDAQVDYGLVACQCNSTYDCARDILSQGDDIFVCVYSTDQNVVITAIEELDFFQGDSLIVGAIDGSEEDLLTSVIQLGPLAVIRSQMRSEFFAVPNPEVMMASGRAAISFANETLSSRRRVRIDNTRILDETGNDGIEARFEISMVLASNAALLLEESHKFEISIFILLGGIIGGLACSTVIFAVILFRRKKKKEDDEKSKKTNPSSAEVANVEIEFNEM